MKLSSTERANILANNPVAANETFYRRVSSRIENFLFGNTKPFGNGRVEGQSRNSPLLHLLVWLKESDRFPELPDIESKLGN